MPRLLFSAEDGFNGRELWTTDGSEAGTRLLADIWPGGGSSGPSQPVPLTNGLALFAATDPVHGTELHVTDGTASGTRLLLDINPGQSGYAGSGPGNFTALGTGRALFTASDQEHGFDLWVSDGREGGTVPLDIAPGPASFYVWSGFTPLGDGRAVFAADAQGSGTELWVTDGSTAGTRVVADINAQWGSSPSSFVSLGNGRAMFSADDGTHGRELWITDGTEAGTFMVADIWPGSTTPSWAGAQPYPNSSYPSNLTLLEPGRVLFTASEEAHGNELWVSDGTAEGTWMVADLETGPGSYNPGNILALGDGRALFAATDSAHGRELWVTDGTWDNTDLVADIWPGGGGSNPGVGPTVQSYGTYGQPYYSTLPGGRIANGEGGALITATDPVHGTELWFTDGTRQGTRLLLDINANLQGYASSNPGNLTWLGDGRVVFTADDGVHGTEAWITDGWTEGTMLLRDIRPDGASGAPSGFAALIERPTTEPPGPTNPPGQGGPDGPTEGIPLPGPPNELWPG